MSAFLLGTLTRNVDRIVNRGFFSLGSACRIWHSADVSFDFASLLAFRSTTLDLVVCCVCGRHDFCFLVFRACLSIMGSLSFIYGYLLLEGAIDMRSLISDRVLRWFLKSSIENLSVACFSDNLTTTNTCIVRAR